MLIRHVSIAAAAFSLGFGIASYVLTLRYDAEIARRDAHDARQIAKAHEQTAQIAQSIHQIEAQSYKEIAHAHDEETRLRRALASGVTRLYVNADCAPMPGATAGASLVNGGRARLKPESEPDYFAIRAQLKRCPAKLRALQSIIKEERDAGNLN